MATVFSPFFGGQMLHLVMNGPGSKKLTLLAFNQTCYYLVRYIPLWLTLGVKSVFLKYIKKRCHLLECEFVPFVSRIENAVVIKTSVRDQKKKNLNTRCH